MNHFRLGHRGFTLLELLAIVAIVMLVIIAIFGAKSIEVSKAQQCQAKLMAMGPVEQQCLLEIAQGSDPCPQCSKFNADIAKYNAGPCQEYGTVSPFVCPVPRPEGIEPQ